MTKQQEILYMQVRLARIFAEKHNFSLNQTSTLFKQNEIFHYIQEGYEIFHTQGDEAILEEIEELLISKGLKL